jgi:hypothetical protein
MGGRCLDFGQKAAKSIKEGRDSADEFHRSDAQGGAAVGIGPIIDIHSLAMVTPVERPADLKGVFAVELRHQGRNAEDLPREKASRGLEEDHADEDSQGEEERPEEARGTISFFA